MCDDCIIVSLDENFLTAEKEKQLQEIDSRWQNCKQAKKFFTKGTANMENNFTRTIDELGRIVIPCEIRAKLGWSEKDILSFHCIDEKSLTLRLAKN